MLAGSGAKSSVVPEYRPPVGLITQLRNACTAEMLESFLLTIAYVYVEIGYAVLYFLLG